MKGIEGRDYGDLPSATVLSAISLNNSQIEYHSFIFDGVGRQRRTNLNLPAI
jgi:hypothetical protein